MVLSKLTVSNSQLWHEMVCLLSCHWFHWLLCVDTGCSAVICISPFHFMLFYLQLRILIHMHIPLELLLVAFCIVWWPYGTNSWMNGMQHRSQTATASYSNINQSQLCHVTSCNSSFHKKNGADNENCFTNCLIYYVQVVHMYILRSTAWLGHQK